jgi:hypothetical protein
VGSVMKMVHNRTNESTIVAEYTTKLNEKSRMVTESRNKSNNTQQLQQANRSRDMVDFDQLPTIGEGSRGEESSSMMHSKSTNNANASINRQMIASSSNADKGNNNDNNQEDASKQLGSRVAGVQMDGSFWQGAEQE